MKIKLYKSTIKYLNYSHIRVVLDIDVDFATARSSIEDTFLLLAITTRYIAVSIRQVFLDR